MAPLPLSLNRLTSVSRREARRSRVTVRANAAASRSGWVAKKLNQHRRGAGERVSLPDTSTIRIEDEKQPGVISYEKMTDANALGATIGGLWRDIVLKLKDRSKVTL